MNSKAFMNARADLNSKCNEVLEDRGPAYAGADLEGDRFANFKLIADLFGNFDVNPNDPKAVLMVYMLKHVLSVLAFIGQGTQGDEKIEGRLVDIRNYVDLLYGLIKEELQAIGTVYIPGKPCRKCGKTCCYPKDHTDCCCHCNPGHHHIGPQGR